MPSIKTAISLDRSLFEEADALAQEMHLSRSRLFVLALEAFIRRRQNRQLQARLNDAYAEEADPSEGARLRGMRLHHREVVGGQW
ncbi:MAG: CopG family transcriptional regulator [Candidatus Eisenbacteria bacterium]|nr:CopG family transcriptional regulator [Candidatus Eisenbacteria bacterium]